MADIYHIQIEQGDSCWKLAFPEPVREELFTDEYSSGESFLEDLVSAERNMLDAIASFYPSEPRRITYDIVDGVLSIGISAGQSSSDMAMAVLSGNDISAMMVLALHVPNYMNVIQNIGLGPVYVQTSIDNKIDPIYMEIGKPAVDELGKILGGMETENNYINVYPHIFPAN